MIYRTDLEILRRPDAVWIESYLPQPDQSCQLRVQQHERDQTTLSIDRQRSRH